MRRTGSPSPGCCCPAWRWCLPSRSTPALGPGRVRFASGTFTADIDLDDSGYVVRYPGLAERIDPR